MNLSSKIKQTFFEKYQCQPNYIVRAPGRVNIIGEHTDYNDGFVLPMTINRAVWIAFSPIEEPKVQVYSLDFQEEVNFALNETNKSNKEFSEYLKGVSWALQQQNFKVKGWRGVVAGDVPLGAGLSSSAALELATARTFSEISGFDWDPVSMAKICQFAENKWVGVNCGIMDQLISATGIENHAVLIDCRSLGYEAVPVPESATIIIMDTSTRRGLVDSAYNERRQQCEEAAKFFNVPALRDVSLEEFILHEHELEPTIRKRARHIISENGRTLQAAQAMKNGNAELLGELMNESHKSLKNDFEVSNYALDEIVSIAWEQAGCLGARMTGAGFGGCAVALVENSQAKIFTDQVSTQYTRKTGLTPKIYICSATNGAEIVERL